MRRHTLALSRFAYRAATLLVCALPCQSQAQNAALEPANDNQTYTVCMQQMGKRVLPYDNVDGLGALGSYRFSVNSLFNGGFCTGTAPSYFTYQWSLCDFKGPAAVYNGIRNAAELQNRSDIQDKLMQQNVINYSTEYKDLLLKSELSRFQRFQNAPDLLGGLLYRKGVTAVKLLTMAGINSLDNLGYSLSDYINFYAQCAGDKTNNQRRTLFSTPSTTIKTTQAQALSWQKLSAMPDDLKQKILLKVPELRLVFGPNEKNAYSMVQLAGETTQTVLVALTGPDFCTEKQCTYYAFRRAFTDVIIFYAGQVMDAPGQKGFYIDGFYKPIEELGR